MTGVPNRVPTNQKSGGSKRNNKRNYSEKREVRAVELAEDGQQYARVTRRLGDGRFEILCAGDGASRLGHVRGKLWKRAWVNVHDLVLVSLRSWQDQKADIINKYTGDEERLLARTGELPIGFGGGASREDDEAHEAGLQAVRKNRYVVMPKDFEKGYKSSVRKPGDDFAFYK